MKFNLKFTSPRGKEIVFDDYYDEISEYGTCWVHMCKHCHNKYRSILKNKSSSGGSGLATCSVKGCENKADYYVDFDGAEVKVIGGN